MTDLFAAAAEIRQSERAPLADRLRPIRLDDIVGQDHLLGEGRPLRGLIEADTLGSILLWGPPGTGKTTLAKVIARTTERVFESLSAVNASVKDVRLVLSQAQDRLGQHGQGTILFLDEVHRFNKSQQDALLPGVETGLITLIGATTENPNFEVNAALRSRSTLFRLEPLEEPALRQLVDRGLDAEGTTASDDAIQLLVDRGAGDGRQVLTALGVASALAKRDGGKISLDQVEAALGTKAIRYGQDDHYDVISAFIKSIRGSDVDAGLYWLARMLDAGESARFIARRLVILASEDIGMADPMSLVIADSAARAVEFVGLPEAQLNLAQAVIHLATAPKSNSVTTAIFAAKEAAQGAGTGQVPKHLRDAHYSGAAGLGHGTGYRYPHNDEAGWVDQQYRPDEVESDVFYRPSAHGAEPARWERWKKDRGDKTT
ncbi:MAG: replication-associated recombination protein A [Acidimicrobiales bacterium]|nr:MAG: replication-associated recombination protein A [Acidimicrobiales bacterium]